MIVRMLIESFLSASLVVCLSYIGKIHGDKTAFTKDVLEEILLLFIIVFMFRVFIT